jgi:hypothetical protein
MNEVLAHTIVLIAGIIAYSVLSLTGHDGTAVLTAVLGYGGGVGVSKATEITSIVK